MRKMTLVFCMIFMTSGLYADERKWSLSLSMPTGDVTTFSSVFDPKIEPAIYGYKISNGNGASYMKDLVCSWMNGPGPGTMPCSYQNGTVGLGTIWSSTQNAKPGSQYAIYGESRRTSRQSGTPFGFSLEVSPVKLLNKSIFLETSWHTSGTYELSFQSESETVQVLSVERFAPNAGSVSQFWLVRFERNRHLVESRNKANSNFWHAGLGFSAFGRKGVELIPQIGIMRWIVSYKFDGITKRWQYQSVQADTATDTQSPTLRFLSEENISNSEKYSRIAPFAGLSLRAYLPKKHGKGPHIRVDGRYALMSQYQDIRDKGAGPLITAKADKLSLTFGAGWSF